MTRQFVFFIFFIFINNIEGNYKRWKRNTNFENPKNWNTNRAPCGNDVVILPDDSPVVYMQLNTTIKEMSLPTNGEIILGKNVNLGFTSEPDAKCPDAGGDVMFTAVHPGPWLDPSSWCSSSTARGQCDTSVAFLDIEKVPCQYDDVIFPKDQTFFVDLIENPFDTPITSLKISGSTFTSSSFATYLNSTDGRRTFKVANDASQESQPRVKSKVKITRKTCTNRGGCACGNDKPELLRLICAHVNKNCQRPRCKQAIQAVGGCCRSCGAVFNITKDYGFSFDDFKAILQTEFFQNVSDVNSIVSVMSGDWVQLVLTDKTGVQSSDLADKIERAINDDVRHGGHKFAVHSFKVERSLAVREPGSSGQHGNALGGGSIAAIVIGVIIILIIVGFIVVIFVYRGTGRPLPSLPNIPRPNLQKIPRPNFSNIPRPNLSNWLPSFLSRSSSSMRSSTNVPQTAPHIDPGFANPMYDNTPFDDHFVMREMDVIGSMKEEQPTFDNAGFNNPLYANTSDSMKFQDATKYGEPGDDATTSGIAVTPSSGASSGPYGNISGKGKNKGRVTGDSPTVQTSAATTGILLDLGTDPSGTDSSI